MPRKIYTANSGAGEEPGFGTELDALRRNPGSTTEKKGKGNKKRLDPKKRKRT